MLMSMSMVVFSYNSYSIDISLDSNVHKRSFDELSEFIDYSEGCSGSGSDGEGELILDLSRTTSSYSDQYLMNV